MAIPRPLLRYLPCKYITRYFKLWIPYLVGVILGIFIYPKSPVSQLEMSTHQRLGANKYHSRKQLYVGVLTAGPFLDTRALAVHRTWGRDVDDLQFFTGGQYTNTSHPDMSIVWFPDIDDSQYPPQDKAFKMLSYMCRHHVDNFHWFVRADDDVYIKVNKLQKLLSTLDSSGMIYLGSPGFGRPADISRLKLNGYNYCMGGPGVIMSRQLLQNLCPHLSDCQKECETVEEDVEIGRCITRHLGIQCTHSWEVSKLFFHAYPNSYLGNDPFTGDLDQDKTFKEAISLHHAKKPDIMYNLRYHHLKEMNSQAAQEIRGYERKLKQL